MGKNGKNPGKSFKDTSQSANQKKKEKQKKEEAATANKKGGSRGPIIPDPTRTGNEKNTGQPEWKGPVGKKKLKLLYGGVVRASGPKEIGEFTVKEWQRLPKTMLREHCQKQKRPNPQFPSAKCSEPGSSHTHFPHFVSDLHILSKNWPGKMYPTFLAYTSNIRIRKIPGARSHARSQWCAHEMQHIPPRGRVSFLFCNIRCTYRLLIPRFTRT